MPTHGSLLKPGTGRDILSRPAPTKTRDEGGFNSSAHARLLLRGKNS